VIDLLVILVSSVKQFALYFRLPNLAVGVLTRDSVRQALRSGITAMQIIDFLRQHAHPEMTKDPPALPLTIVDQVRYSSNYF